MRETASFRWLSMPWSAAEPSVMTSGEAVPVPRQAQQRETIASLTGIRGAAAWWVALHNYVDYLPPVPMTVVRFLNMGYLAVDLFFVLSGFIISYSYLGHFRTVSRGEVVQFLGARLARIYPLHFAVLLLYLVNPIAIALAATAGIDWHRYDIGYYVMSLFLVQNWGFTGLIAWNVPAWSISAEWFAYLIFPIIVIVTRRVLLSAWMALALIGLLLLGLALKHSTTGFALGADIPHTGLFRCLVEFSAGILVHHIWTRWRQSGVAWWLAMLIAVLGAAGHMLLDLPDYWTMPVAWTGLIYALATNAGTLSAVLSIRLLVYLGTISYSTYMVHYLVRDWVKFILVKDTIPPAVALAGFLIGTLGLSIVLYHLVETPGRRIVRRWILRSTRRPA
jgi:peptidoglycan/LPS O-acetylase OafA/YrhL